MLCNKTLLFIHSICNSLHLSANIDDTFNSYTGDKCRSIKKSNSIFCKMLKASLLIKSSDDHLK